MSLPFGREGDDFVYETDVGIKSPLSPKVELRVIEDMLILARRVLAQQRARKDEDVVAWAERIAKDVGEAGD